MEIKDLECKVELGSEMSEVRGGLYYRRPYLPGLKFDTDGTHTGTGGGNRSSDSEGAPTVSSIGISIHRPRSSSCMMPKSRTSAIRPA